MMAGDAGDRVGWIGGREPPALARGGKQDEITGGSEGHPQQYTGRHSQGHAEGDPGERNEADTPKTRSFQSGRLESLVRQIDEVLDGIEIGQSVLLHRSFADQFTPR